MGVKISGIDINTMIGDLAVQVREITLSIEDGSKAVMSRGRPNGHVRGAVSAGGDLTVDKANLDLILEAAKTAGSFQELEPFDIVFNADVGDQSLNIEAFECLIKLSDLLNSNDNGEEKLTHKIPFEVTGKDFIRIDGVPYAAESEKDYLR
ncbi:DUF2597 family protein [Gammaproteobacteria bacterium]|nr:DUF2597 family protein [Gammaproteobacteria bacterium]